MQKINLNVIVDEVIKHNKKVATDNDHNNIKKDTTTVADMISKKMLEDANKFKD